MKMIFIIVISVHIEVFDYWMQTEKSLGKNLDKYINQEPNLKKMLKLQLGNNGKPQSVN